MKLKKILLSTIISMLSIASLTAASSFKGKARTRIGVDTPNAPKSEITFGILDKSSFDGEFMLQEMIKSSKGKGDGAYADVEAFAKVRLNVVDGSFFDTWQSLDDFGKNLEIRLGFNKADLVFNKDKNFKFSILGRSPMNRYARGWEVNLDNGDLIETEPFVTNNTAFFRKASDPTTYEKGAVTGAGNTKATGYARARGGYVPNIALTYDKYSVVLGLDGGYGGRTNYIAPDAETTDNNGDQLRKFANKDKVNYLAVLGMDGVTVSDKANLSLQGGIFNSYKMTMADTTGNQISLGQQTHVLYGGKLAYKTDKLNFELGATGNVRINDGLAYTDTNEANAVEASLNIDYHDDVAVSFDAWFLDNQALWSDEALPDYVCFDNRSDMGYVYRDKDGNIYVNEAKNGTGENNRTLHKALSMRLKAKPAKDAAVVLTMQDVLNQGIYGVQVPVKASESLTITPAFEYTVNTSKIYDGSKGKWVEDSANRLNNSIIDGKVECLYKHSKFWFTGSVRFGKESAADGMYIKPYVSITSRNLIEGAQLSLIWKNGVFGSAKSSPSGKLHDGNYIGNAYIEARINFK